MNNFIIIFTLKSILALGLLKIPITEQAIDLNYAETKINEIRTENGLSALKASECLRSRAKIRLDDVTKVWSHTRPDGNKSYTAKNCGGTLQGENLAKDTINDDIAITAWMQSKTHKEVILSNVKNIGIIRGGGYLIMEVNK